ncbi:Sedlin [Sistotremastrum niveocremeum HHB9708]|uniref:Trafficking protein particle complex subunit 2-like protein n=2 Tax=Sistotremastraceae TaxID=3402574 RepID=A0A164VGM4_9AGAM|nr:Sedlin [Sistotremastrum niveocremeum HHB9708]KZT38921.1 trafficking protein particle complex 2 [Sistotremastrum suecicum HHB10207 ss-3]
MPPLFLPLRLSAVAFISAQNHPIFVESFSSQGNNIPDDLLKAHYTAHTSLDIFDERVGPHVKSTESYLGLLYAMEDVAVYGYITATKVKIVAVLVLSDSIVRDAEVITIFKALHVAYQQSLANPFLKLYVSEAAGQDPAQLLQSNNGRWKGLQKRVERIAKAVGQA